MGVQPVTTLLLTAALTATSAPADSLTLERVLARAGAYVTQFERQLSGIVAEEQYVQEVRFPDANPARAPLSRQLRSDLLLVRPIGAKDWLQFRDVYEVDGEPVRGREDRLEKLFLNPAGSLDRQLWSIISESARYNIGSLMRTINIPLLPLLFLDPGHQERFKFKRTNDSRPNGMVAESPAPPGHFKIATEVWAIEYHERWDHTMVRTTDHKDLPAEGRFWIEPATGRVLMSELILQNRSMRGTITVNCSQSGDSSADAASEPLAGLLVPVEMRERYDRLADKSIIEGFATYGRFRRFQVKVDEKLGPIVK